MQQFDLMPYAQTLIFNLTKSALKRLILVLHLVKDPGRLHSKMIFNRIQFSVNFDRRPSERHGRIKRVSIYGSTSRSCQTQFKNGNNHNAYSSIRHLSVVGPVDFAVLWRNRLLG